MGYRADALADRIEQGARALAELAETLTDVEWSTPVARDGRTVGILVHHVASMYPIEIDLTRKLASGEPVAGVTWDAVAAINAGHAQAHAGSSKRDALELLARNSRAAADAVRALTDEQLDRAAPVSLDADAPLTAQYFIEAHPVRHSFHHLSRIRTALGR